MNIQVDKLVGLKELDHEIMRLDLTANDQDRKNETEERFREEIDELNQETEELVQDIEKWQT